MDIVNDEIRARRPARIPGLAERSGSGSKHGVSGVRIPGDLPLGDSAVAPQAEEAVVEIRVCRRRLVLEGVPGMARNRHGRAESGEG